MKAAEHPVGTVLFTEGDDLFCFKRGKDYWVVYFPERYESLDDDDIDADDSESQTVGVARIEPEEEDED